MPQDESKEINARLLHYECQLEAERKLNRIYQAQIDTPGNENLRSIKER